jgi:hypothetical protein
MSSSTDALIDEADEKLDKNDFQGARDAYRAAALAEEPGIALLSNLGVADVEERLAFARALAARHPTSLDVALVKIDLVSAAHPAPAVVMECDTLLQGSDWAPPEASRIRLSRFRAALAGKYHRFLKEDFEALWRGAGAARKPVEANRTLVRWLAQVADTGAADAIRDLASSVPEGSTVHRFLMAKSAELELLGAAFADE